MQRLDHSPYRVYSFLAGLTNLFNFGHLTRTHTLKQYDISKIRKNADFHAISSDWTVTGDDLRKAIEQFEQLYIEGSNDRGKRARTIQQRTERERF